MTGDIRLGVIVPSVNIVVEAWYPRAVPAGVSVHFARMLMPAAPRLSGSSRWTAPTGCIRSTS